MLSGMIAEKLMVNPNSCLAQANAIGEAGKKQAGLWEGGGGVGGWGWGSWPWVD